MAVYIVNDEGENPGDIPVTRAGLERRFIKSAAGFLSSTAAKAIPAFRTLTAADIPASLSSIVEVLSTDPGASGAELDLYQNSASPAVADLPGILNVYAKDANGTKTLVGQVAVGLKETTAGAMSTYLQLITLDDGTQRGLYLNPDLNAFYADTDNHWDLGIASTNRFRAAYFTGQGNFGTVEAGTTMNAGTGYQVGGVAASGAVLVGNGTNYVAGTTVWTAVTHTAGDYTADTGTWTVDSGDLTSFAYVLIGKTMHISFEFTTTSNSSAAATRMEVLIPASKSANRRCVGAGVMLENGVVFNPMIKVIPAISATKILIFKDPTAATAYIANTNTLTIGGSITIETT